MSVLETVSCEGCIFKLIQHFNRESGQERKGRKGVTFLEYSRTPPILTLVIRTANFPDRLGPSGKFVDNSTKLTCLEITGYRIKYSTVSWLLELQIRRVGKV